MVRGKNHKNHPSSLKLRSQKWLSTAAVHSSLLLPFNKAAIL
ncbi:hypothetical protein [Priestia megaterium]